MCAIALRRNIPRRLPPFRLCLNSTAHLPNSFEPREGVRVGTMTHADPHSFCSLRSSLPNSGRKGKEGARQRNTRIIQIGIGSGRFLSRGRRARWVPQLRSLSERRSYSAKKGEGETGFALEACSLAPASSFAYTRTRTTAAGSGCRPSLSSPSSCSLMNV